MEFLNNLVKKYTSTSLILRIVIGLVVGAVLGVALKSWTWVGIMGSLFVGALRAVAPILVFVRKEQTGQEIRPGAVLLYDQYFSRCGSRSGSQLYVPCNHEAR